MTIWFIAIGLSLVVNVVLFLKLVSARTEIVYQQSANEMLKASVKDMKVFREADHNDLSELRKFQEVMVQMATICKAKYMALSDTGAIWSNLSQMQREQYTEAARLRVLEGTLGNRTNSGNSARS